MENYAYVNAAGVLIRFSSHFDPSPDETTIPQPEGVWLEAGKWRWDGGWEAVGAPGA